MVLFIMFTSSARDLCMQKITMVGFLMCCTSNVYKVVCDWTVFISSEPSDVKRTLD